MWRMHLRVGSVTNPDTSARREPPKLLPLFESSCLRSTKPCMSLYEGGHGQAEVMEVRRNTVKRIWLSRSRWIMMGEELEK